MLRNYILFLLVLFCSILLGQKKEPNMGIGFSLSTKAYFLPPNNWWATPITQAQFLYLPQANQIITFSLGAGLVKNISNLKPQIPIWTSLSYMRIYRYDKKKTTRLLIGGNLNMGVGEFVYGRDRILSAFFPHYKRIFLDLSPQIGIWHKTGKKSYFTAILSAGVGSLFLKASQVPVGGFYNDKFFSTFGLRLEYNFLFNSKRR